ncbi:MAG: YkgJ family cysteine cluster protein [Candidatus Poribacteria bacterium]
MEYVPWKQVNNWLCLGCGKCCYRYAIQLKDDEAAMIRKFWSDAVEERRGRIYLRKVGKKCLFQSGQSCALQPLGLKPIACKIWPFYFSTVPIIDWDSSNYQSQFLCRGKEYFVYVNTSCYGVNRGTQSNLRKVISEIIMLQANPKEQQHYSTSLRYPRGQNQSSDEIWNRLRNLRDVDFMEDEVNFSKPDPLLIKPKEVKWQDGKGAKRRNY